MADINEVAKVFVQFYYGTFDSDRKNLRNVYKDISMLSFEGAQIQGVNGIIEKLASLPFRRIEHKIQTVDAQPSHPSAGSILVSVTGQLLTDDEQNPQRFCQTFQLVPDGPGNYFVFNDIFRLCYVGLIVKILKDKRDKNKILK
ncbi:nuclear transport factor 2 [Neocallimastix lanati (nom. inval.)]|uniref:NTF2-related export protein n=1 Tax=Neocallimastix californiae TaxID=1754190 RepID=A0A1Y1YXK0_9FUNG|nr:nuclear transport factor 2 [Neocallimastix sp. JGI-2020a]ORY02768.1 nuclear transport factor 2 [Neocallimastix californiae]|eukprot:ORY02768.1 nuclear transport factor 2 [Neocallimastix californiae]